MLCSICKEDFTSLDCETTFSSKCGHVFHHHCILQWLERSKTCPYCRTALNRNSIFKLNILFGDLPPRTEEEDWRNRNANFQQLLSNVEIQQIRNQSKTALEQNAGLRTEIKKLEDIIRERKTLECQLREQVEVLTNQLKTSRAPNSRASVIDLDTSRRDDPNECFEVVDLSNSPGSSRASARELAAFREEKEYKEALLNSAYSRIHELEGMTMSLEAQNRALVQNLKRIQQANDARREVQRV